MPLSLTIETHASQTKGLTTPLTETLKSPWFGALDENQGYGGKRDIGR